MSVLESCHIHTVLQRFLRTFLSLFTMLIAIGIAALAVGLRRTTSAALYVLILIAILRKLNDTLEALESRFLMLQISRHYCLI